MGGILFIVWTVLIMAVGFAEGGSRVRGKIYQKCLVEMEQKPHKEATIICNERVE